MMVKGDYSKALMKLDVWTKDMSIIGAFAREVGAWTPLFDRTAPLYAAATRGGGQRDTAAVHRVLAESSKYKVQSRK